MLYGDMAYLPWFNFPEEYHFGGHTFTTCGYDGGENVLASDINPETTGLKKGFYHPITLTQLRKARGSKHKPFPPKNAWLEFDFTDYKNPREEDIYSAIKQTIDDMTDPPISNFGIKGIKRTSREITRWPTLFDYKELRMNLFNIYIYIEVGGTGGGCFRYMYSRFLKEGRTITKNRDLEKAADMIQLSGQKFSEIALLFKDAENSLDLEKRINKAHNLYLEIADIEEEAFQYLSKIIDN
jgi:hypothetical protein